MSSRTLRITLLASEWKSSKGGLSTMNRELAIQLAKHPNVSVSFLVPKCSDEDKKEASSHNVKILEAKERPGFEPNVWLAFPPKDLVIDFVVGHGVILGKQAQIIRDYHHCQWVQVVHTAPYELAMYKTYSGAISKGNEKQRTELKLCKMADLVIAVGPKLVEFYTAHLSSCDKKVYNFTPGIFTELSSLKLSSQSGKFRLLVFGRGDSEDFELKGYDIAAQAVAKLNDKSFHLTFVGAPSDSEDQVTEELLKQGLDRSQLIVEGYLEDREYLVTLLCASNLVVVPSRTEGFGLTALEALSAGLPFLVSQNSGFGEAVKEMSLGSTFVVDSEDPEQWAEAIKRVRQLGGETAIQECQELRTQYAEKYSWNRQTKDLLSIMLSSFNGDDQSKKEEMSEYLPPKQTLSQKGITPLPVRVVEPVVPLRHFTSLSERSTARERVQSPSAYAPGETRAPHIRDQGAWTKEQSSSNTECSTLELKDLSIVGEKKEESKSQQRRGESGLQRWDTLRLEDKPKTSHRYPIASAGHATKEHAALYTAKEGKNQRLGGSDPLQCDTFGFEKKPNTTFPSTTYREYHPKQKLPPPPAMSLLPSKATKTTGRLNPEESKSQQRRGKSGTQRWDTLRLEDKPKTSHRYPIASAGHATKEHAALYTAKEDKNQRLGGSDPLQCDTFGFEEKPNTTFPSTTYREYHPKRKLPPPPAMSLLPSKATKTTGRLNPEESKSQQRRGKSGTQRWDTLRLEDKPKTKDPYPIASAGHRTNENAALYTAKADNFQRLGGSDPLQCDTFGLKEKPNTTFPSTTYRENAAFSTERAGGFQETAPPRFKIMERRDLSVVGWSAKRESLSAVTQVIQEHRDILSLSTDPDVLNLAVNDMISYLENNPLKYCVLVVDTEKVIADRDQNLGDNYRRLLQTAERNVAKKVIIVVCDSLPLPQNNEEIVHQTIYRIVKERDKVFIAWLKNGKLSVDPDVLEQLLLSSKPTMGHVIPQGSRPEGSQRPTNVPSFSATESRQNYVDQPRCHLL